MTDITVQGSAATEQNDATKRLFAAVANKEVEFVRRLLKSSDRPMIDVNSRDSQGQTCLGLAASEGNIALVKILVENGADMNNPDFYSENPLQYATEFGHIDIVEYLLQAGADVNFIMEDRLSALHIAACRGQTGIAKLLINNKCDVNILTRKGVSALHCAVTNGHYDMLQLLLESGANANIRGQKYQRTPIFMAGEAGNEQMAMLLIQHGAKLNLTDQYGMTPLNMVCNRRNSAIAKKFITANAIVNLADATGSIPLHYIARSGDIDVARMLLYAGSKVDVINKHAKSPLHLAVRMMHADIVQLLVNHGCQTNICDPSDGIRPLHIAVYVYNDIVDFEHILACLVDGGCDLDARSANCETALYRALDLGKVHLATLLLQYGADVNVECPHGVTILNKACQRGMTEFIRLLTDSSWKWRQERWLLPAGTGYITGFRRRNLGKFLLQDDDEFKEDEVPLILWNRVPLYRYLRHTMAEPLTLQKTCRLVLRTALMSSGGGRLFTKIDSIPDFPVSLKTYLKLQSACY